MSCSATFELMRYGIAIDLHAPASASDAVSWERVRGLATSAERLGLDLVVVPDHLSYRAGDLANGYSVADEPVGVRESMTVAAGLAACTTRIGVGHSVVNAPYRSPSMLAHLAAGLAEISAGRYSLGIGVGNSYDYEQLGVAADHRTARFEECVGVVAALLRDGAAHLDGRYWHADRAELALRPDDSRRPPIIVAAGGPRTMDVAARHGDGWNGWLPTDPDGAEAERLLGLLASACRALGRDPSSITRTADLAIDPLDQRGARARSLATLRRLAELGIDEVRCYTVHEGTHASRAEALEAYAALVREV